MDRTNEECLDLFADLIEPCAEILGDPEVRAAFETNKLKAVKAAIKNHKKAVIEILALVDGADPATYKVGVLTLPLKVLELLNKPEVVDLFQSQAQMKTAAGSGSATANTRGGAV